MQTNVARNIVGHKVIKKTGTCLIFNTGCSTIAATLVTANTMTLSTRANNKLYATAPMTFQVLYRIIRAGISLNMLNNAHEFTTVR